MQAFRGWRVLGKVQGSQPVGALLCRPPAFLSPTSVLSLFCVFRVLHCTPSLWHCQGWTGILCSRPAVPNASLQVGDGGWLLQPQRTACEGTCPMSVPLNPMLLAGRAGPPALEAGARSQGAYGDCRHR
jgi:hypothetical protein